MIFFIIVPVRRWRIPVERLKNPRDPYYRCCCCSDIFKVVPIVNLIGIGLDVLVAILSLILVCIAVAVTIWGYIIPVIYPLISSLIFIALYVNNRKANYGIPICIWILPQYLFAIIDLMISILVIVIAFVYNTNDCDYDGYTGSYDGDCDNGDDSTISVGAQIACIVIGLLYFALFIIRMISQALQLKIRNYWIYILSKKNASNATTAPSPPPYQPNVEANPPGFSPGQVYSVSNQVPNQSVGSSLQIPRAQTPAHFQQNLGNSPNKSSTYPTKNLDSDDAWT